MQYIWIVLSSVGLGLQVLVIHAMTKGAYKRFAVVFVYVVTLFLTSVAEGAAFYNPEIWQKRAAYYWIMDTSRQVLIYAVVISLVHAVMGENPARAAVRRALVAGAVLFAGLSFYFTQEDVFGTWMAGFGRNLGFCAVILNLILWAVLIKSRSIDRRLLLISGGLGIQMAGKAIGHALRPLSPTISSVGDLFIVLTHLLCLYIWWQAFRRTEDASGGVAGAGVQ